MPVKVVSERLAHAHVSITLAIYTHVSVADEERAAEATSAFLDG